MSMAIQIGARWLLLASLTGADGSAAGRFGYWPQFRGPNRDGVSSDRGLLAKWPEGGPRVEWKSGELGEGYSSVALAGDRIYILGASGEEESIHALNAADGRKVWSKRIGSPFRNKWGDGPRSTPVVAGERVYVLGSRGDLCCFAAADGKPLWNVNVLEKFSGRNIKWGISESPLVDGDRVICNTGGRGGSVVAFDAQTGSVAWRSVGLDEGCAYASAVTVDVGGVRQYVHFLAGAAVGIRAVDGKPLWRYEKVANDTANCSNPVISGDLVFLSSAYDTGSALLKLLPDKDGTRVEEVYFTRELMNHHGGVILHEGYLYGCSNKMLTCLELKTGKEMWTNRGVGKGALTLADGKLYCISERGDAGLIAASPGGYEELGRFRVEPSGPATFAHLAVTGGRMYLRNGGELICYDVKRQ